MLKHTMDIDQAYKDVDMLMNQLSNKWHYRYMIPFEDCKSECHVAFVTAFRRFDPQRKAGAKFSTFVQMICQFRLRRLVMERCAEPKYTTLEDWTPGAGFAPDVHSESLQLVQDLSEDAREIVSLIFEMPGDLKGFRRPMEPTDYLERIKKYLVKKRGKSEHRVEQAALEIQTTLRTAWAMA